MAVAETKIRVLLPSLLQACTGGQGEVEIEAETLQACLDRMLERFPLLRVHLFDEAGEIRQHVSIFFNEENLSWVQDRQTPLRAGDRLTILQAVSGG